jgi:hypothetical protein
MGEEGAGAATTGAVTAGEGGGGMVGVGAGAMTVGGTFAAEVVGIAAAVSGGGVSGVETVGAARAGLGTVVVLVWPMTLAMATAERLRNEKSDVFIKALWRNSFHFQ